LEGDLANI